MSYLKLMIQGTADQGLENDCSLHQVRLANEQHGRNTWLLLTSSWLFPNTVFDTRLIPVETAEFFIRPFFPFSVLSVESRQ
jgi:hypothetical protein